MSAHIVAPFDISNAIVLLEYTLTQLPDPGPRIYDANAPIGAKEISNARESIKRSISYLRDCQDELERDRHRPTVR